MDAPSQTLKPAAGHAALPRDAWVTHVAPFAAWIFLMGLLGDPAGWKYAVRTVAGLAVFLAFRPWRWYPRLQAKHVPSAVLLGVLVFLMWIAGETDWAARHAGWHRFYLTFATQPPWKLSPPAEHLAYAPEVCGWGFTLTRIAGSAFVIAFIEEFFWRGWMYRWAIREDFLNVDLGYFDWKMWVAVSALFATIHHRWLVGFLCGLAYGLYAIRTRDVWAAGIAHVVTNLLLGIYVVWAEKYEFWS